MRWCGWLAAAALAAAVAGGCREKEPANVFPGTKWYDARVASMNVSPETAFMLARRAAVDAGRTQYITQRPLVIYDRQYVFSLPVAGGVSLKGYHVDGDDGTVRFYTKDTILKP
jgi:hypothetical protein